MNRYEEKQQRRRERYRAQAEKAARESNAAHDQARRMADAIPMGQPILVGHHSEHRDRRYRERIHNTMGTAVALSEKADYYQQKAAGVGLGGISSDDPEAIAKLQQELESKETAHKTMVAANRLVRKQDRAGLAALGFSETQIGELFKPDFCGRIGFPDYTLTNSNANIRRIRERIEILKARDAAGDKEEVAVGYTYREDTSENRVMFLFPGKPTKPIRELLKSNGFRWSPSRGESGAWVRPLNNRGIYAAKCVREKLDQMIEAAPAPAAP